MVLTIQSSGMLTKEFWLQMLMGQPPSEEHFSAKKRSGGFLCPEFLLVDSMKLQESSCSTSVIAQIKYLKLQWRSIVSL